MSESEEGAPFRQRLAKVFIRRTLPEHYNPNADQTVLAMMALTVAEALDKHGEALTRAATASDKYSSRLIGATWALVGSTAALVIAAVMQIIVTWCRG